MNHLTSLAAVAALALTAGCSSPSSTGIADVTCPTGSTLTYESFGKTFFDDHCLECHATKKKPTLSTQALIHSNSQRILHEAVYTDAMPEDGDMSLAEREMLGEWLACGAP